MKDYLGVYIRFLIGLGALLILGLLLQSFTSGQQRSRQPDELVEYLKREKMWEAKRKTGEYLERQRDAGIKAAAQQKAAKLASLQWETVTVRMRRYGYEPELVQQEMADLEKLMGGKLAPKSLERCEDGVYKATFQWVSP